MQKAIRNRSMIMNQGNEPIVVKQYNTTNHQPQEEKFTPDINYCPIPDRSITTQTEIRGLLEERNNLIDRMKVIEKRLHQLGM